MRIQFCGGQQGLSTKRNRAVRLLGRGKEELSACGFPIRGRAKAEKSHFAVFGRDTTSANLVNLTLTLPGTGQANGEAGEQRQRSIFSPGSQGERSPTRVGSPISTGPIQ